MVLRKIQLHTIKMKVFRFIWNIPRMVLIMLISFYQKTLSPDHGVIRGFFPGGYCRYTPSCSDYGKAVIKKHGVFIGEIKAAYRVIRCNPFSKGGIDLPN